MFALSFKKTDKKILNKKKLHLGEVINNRPRFSLKSV